MNKQCPHLKSHYNLKSNMAVTSQTSNSSQVSRNPGSVIKFVDSFIPRVPEQMWPKVRLPSTLHSLFLSCSLNFKNMVNLLRNFVKMMRKLTICVKVYVLTLRNGQYMSQFCLDRPLGRVWGLFCWRVPVCRVQTGLPRDHSTSYPINCTRQANDSTNASYLFL